MLSYYSYNGICNGNQSMRQSIEKNWHYVAAHFGHALSTDGTTLTGPQQEDGEL